MATNDALKSQLAEKPQKQVAAGQLGLKIEHVRFTPKRKRIVKMDNTEVLTNGVLYIDAVNSKPFVNPSEDGTITFQNRKLKIVECYEVYTDQLSPHHIEVMLQ